MRLSRRGGIHAGRQVAAAGVTAYRDAVLTDTPDVYHRMVETSGSTMSDSSGNSRTGTYYGPTLGVTGPTLDTDTSAASFDGTDDYCSVPEEGIPVGRLMTVEAWVKRQTDAEFIIALTRDGSSGWKFELETNGRFLFTFLGEKDQRGPGDFLVGTDWTHVAATITETGTLNFYKNGVTSHTYTDTFANAIATTGDIPIVGAARINGATVSNWTPGVMAERAIYPTALTGTRILAHYNAGVA